MNKYSIKISQKAYSDIVECVSFLKKVSLEAAKKLHEEIIESIKSLEVFQNKYPEIPGVQIKDIKVRKMPIHDGRYVILYKVEKNVIVIYDILDTRKETRLSIMF